MFLVSHHFASTPSDGNSKPSGAPTKDGVPGLGAMCTCDTERGHAVGSLILRKIWGNMQNKSCNHCRLSFKCQFGNDWLRFPSSNSVSGFNFTFTCCKDTQRHVSMFSGFVLEKKQVTSNFHRKLKTMMLTHWVMDSGPTSNCAVQCLHPTAEHIPNHSIQRSIRTPCPYAICLRFVVLVFKYSQKRHTDTRWCQQALLQGCSQPSWMWFQRRSARRVSQWKDGKHSDNWICKRHQQNDLGLQT